MTRAAGIDRRGRLLGKVSIVDLAAVGIAAVCVSPVAYYTYELAAGNWQLQVTGLNVDRVTPGLVGSIIVEGRQFDRWSEVRFGDRPYQPAKLLANPHHLEVEVPSDLDAGWYDIAVRDRRHRVAVLPKALEVLPRPPRFASQIDVVCLLKVSREQMNALRRRQGALKRKSPRLLGIYGGVGEGIVGTLASVQLPGEVDTSRIPPRCYYQQQELQVGTPLMIVWDHELIPAVVTSPPVMGPWEPLPQAANEDD
jgi:hypothetical protein